LAQPYFQRWFPPAIAPLPFGNARQRHEFI
jgi:hypothetical protein